MKPLPREVGAAAAGAINPLIGHTSPVDTLARCCEVVQLFGVVSTAFGGDGADNLGDGPRAGICWALECVAAALRYELEAQRPWAGGAT